METESNSFEKTSINEFCTFYLSQRHRFMAFILGLVRNRSVAEDILQEVWLKLAEAAETGVVIGNKTAWCRAVARNLILHYWRDRQREQAVGDAELIQLVESAFDETESLYSQTELRREFLAQCLPLLPDKSQELLKLKYYAGLSAKSIGAAFHQSPESILMALSRARRAIAQCIEARLKGAINL